MIKVSQSMNYKQNIITAYYCGILFRQKIAILFLSEIIWSLQKNGFVYFPSFYISICIIIQEWRLLLREMGWISNVLFQDIPKTHNCTKTGDFMSTCCLQNKGKNHCFGSLAMIKKTRLWLINKMFAACRHN